MPAQAARMGACARLSLRPSPMQAPMAIGRARAGCGAVTVKERAARLSWFVMVFSRLELLEWRHLGAVT